MKSTARAAEPMPIPALVPWDRRGGLLVGDGNEADEALRMVALLVESEVTAATSAVIDVDEVGLMLGESEVVEVDFIGVDESVSTEEG